MGKIGRGKLTAKMKSKGEAGKILVTQCPKSVFPLIRILRTIIRGRSTGKSCVRISAYSQSIPSIQRKEKRWKRVRKLPLAWPSFPAGHISERKKKVSSDHATTPQTLLFFLSLRLIRAPSPFYPTSPTSRQSFFLLTVIQQLPPLSPLALFLHFPRSPRNGTTV